MRLNSVERVRASFGQIIVPPFECFWLRDPDLLFPDEQACIVFEVCGETDATIILKAKPGSRRWQYSSGSPHPNEKEDNYVIIFGSHRNSLLSLERNGEKKEALRKPWTCISPNTFTKFWICYSTGTIYVGTGEPSADFKFKWEDLNPLPGIQCAGLSAWDKHCTFRKVCVQPVLPWLTKSLQAPSLFDLAASSLQLQLDVSLACRCIWVFDTLDLQNLGKLRNKVKSLLAQEFDSFINDYRDVFCTLSGPTVCSILQSPELASNERLILDSVISWMFYGREPGANTAVRGSHEIREVLKWVRFTTIEEEELQTMLLKAMAIHSQELRSAIADALYLQSLANESDTTVLTDGSSTSEQCPSLPYGEPNLYLSRTLHRGVQLHYQFLKDTRGVIHYLAHDCGRSPWKNPMVNEKLLVKASSPTSKFTRPKDIVGDKFIRTNFAGPERENGNWKTWWMIDLLDFVLVCNYYRIRHDASHDFARNWDFEASNDGENWIKLRKHVNDFTIACPGAYGAWPIFFNAKAYRMFRLLLTKPTESLVFPYNMALSSIELYGTLSGPGVV